MSIWTKMKSFFSPPAQAWSPRRESTSPVERTASLPKTRIKVYQQLNGITVFVPQYESSFGRWYSLSTPLLKQEEAIIIIENFRKKKPISYITYP